MDGNDRIYAADTGGQVVRMDDISGRRARSLGSTEDSPHLFATPGDVAIDSQNRVYVTDMGNSRVVRVDNISGTGWTSLGSPGIGPRQFGAPWGVAVDPRGHFTSRIRTTTESSGWTI